MAKSRAQRKAEQRRKRELGLDDGDAESQAQHDTQVPESAEVAEVEAAMEAGAAEAQRSSAAPAPSRADVGRPAEDSGEAGDQVSRRERRRQEKEAAQRSRAQLDRRAPKTPQAERQRGAVMSFFSSVIKELQKVQWPDRDTLVQASAVTLLFVAVAAAYLGVLDAIFSWLVDQLIT
jgi:preprotein translocase SecE subunit